MAKKSKCSTSLIYFLIKNILIISYLLISSAISIAELWIDPLGLFNVSRNGFEGIKDNITVRDVLKQDILDFRSGLPSKIKNSGNAASAEINIEGVSINKLFAHSRIDESIIDKGIVGKGKNIFRTQILPSADGKLINRAIDSEAKIFEHLADQLGNNTSARGIVTILTERPACDSCLGVADQFRIKYPNINVNIIDNGGNVLKPPRKN